MVLKNTRQVVTHRILSDIAQYLTKIKILDHSTNNIFKDYFIYTKINAYVFFIDMLNIVFYNYLVHLNSFLHPFFKIFLSHNVYVCSSLI